jgi:hypothetical protein
MLINLPVSFSPALTFGAHWAFQTEQQSEGIFSEALNASKWLIGKAIFTFSGSRKTNFDNYGLAHTAYHVTVRASGRLIAWNTDANSSKSSRLIGKNTSTCRFKTAYV